MIKPSSLREINDNTDNIAVKFTNVSKEYRLYDSPKEQAIDVLGLARLRFWRSTKYRTFLALEDINLVIKHGERVGIIGPNGAGKTTLLKLITGNFSPTSGEIDINGEVQALMQTGLGFHSEFTGYENIKSSLIFNGLSGKDLEKAVEDIIGFCELGDFLYQPVKTYSLGMRARLQFAVATAIKPDIVIVDEVLGAGDAYFNKKSSERMAKLADSGCTLLIVSHSMQQVMQYCRRVIWLNEGKIIEDNEPLPVIKAYERSTFEKSSKIGRKNNSNQNNSANDNLDFTKQTVDRGISRWDQCDSSLLINSVSLLNKTDQTCAHFKNGDFMSIEIEVRALQDGMFPCRFLVLIFNSEGIPVTWHLSKEYILEIGRGERKKARLVFNELLLTSGSYMMSTAIYEYYNAVDKTKLRCYDLISKSYDFIVENNFSGSPAIIQHPAQWHYIDGDK